MSRASSLARRLVGLAPIAASCLLLAAPSAGAAPVRGSNAIQAPGSEQDAAGQMIGDFNGDGIDDYVAMLNSTVKNSSVTASVVFGSRSLDNLTLRRSTTTGAVMPIGARGMQITSALPSTATFQTFNEVTGAGDVDRDGYDDVVVGYDLSYQSTPQPHRAFLVYGAPGNAAVPLVAGPRVTVINLTTTQSDTQNDSHVDGAGDFNGDGYGDVVVTRSTGSINEQTEATGATIVYGGPRVATIDATVQGSRTSLLSGYRACNFDVLKFKTVCTATPVNTTSIGDFNGDGKSDLFVDNGRDDGRGILLGRTGTFTQAAGSPNTKLTGTVAARAWAPDAVHAAGDLNGDGKADFAFRLPTSTDAPYAMGIVMGRASPPASIAMTGATTIQSAGQSVLGVAPGPDLNGDGRGDLAVVTEQITEPFRRFLRIVPNAGNGGTVNVDGVAPVEGVPTEIGYLTRFWNLEGGGDLDADGQPDLLYGDTIGGGLHIVSASPDRSPPELASAADPADRAHAAGSGVWLAPYDFTQAAGTTLGWSLLEPAQIDLVYTRTDGSVVGQMARVAAAGRHTEHWNGKLGNVPLPIGDYRVAIIASDDEDNLSAIRKFSFSVVAPGSESGAPASMTYTTHATLPNGQPANVYVPLRVTCPYEWTDWTQPEVTTTLDVDRFAGDTCTFHVMTAAEAGMNNAITCDEGRTITVNGNTTAGSDRTFRFVAGANKVDIAVKCRDTAAENGVVGVIGEAGWVARGSAQFIGDGQVKLTGGANQTGSAVWGNPIDPNGKTIRFATNMRNGNGQAEGMTISFLNAAQTDPATGFLGAGKAGLGFGGLKGTAIAFDMAKGTGDPAANSIGVATEGSASGLTWLQNADAVTNMRGSAVDVKVVSKNGVVQVLINDVVRLTRTMTLPSPAYIALTASTSATWQEQYAVGLTMLPTK